MSQSRAVTNPETIQELQRLYQEKGKLLHPTDVVDAARSEDSPLHRHFEWDDGVAAERWRTEQARDLLQRVYVRMKTSKGDRMSQVFVSLTTDREEGGYRTMVDVLSDKDMRNQLIRDAMADMQTFEQRYKTLKELAVVFSAIRKAKGKLEAAV